jgi:hypothetical protein
VTGRLIAGAAGESACRPGSVHPLARAGGHPSGTAVAGSLVRSTREHRAGRPRTLAQAPRPEPRDPSDLAPGGVYLAAWVTPGAGGLLHHRFTLTPGRPEGRSRGGLLSVALSRGSPRVGVTDHPALRSPDLPHRVSPARPPGRLARRDHQHRWSGSFPADNRRQRRHGAQRQVSRRLQPGLDLLPRDGLGRRRGCLAGSGRAGRIFANFPCLTRRNALKHCGELSRDNRGEALAVLGEVDDLAAGSLMRRLGHTRRGVNGQFAHAGRVTPATDSPGCSAQVTKRACPLAPLAWPGRSRPGNAGVHGLVGQPVSVGVAGPRHPGVGDPAERLGCLPGLRGERPHVRVLDLPAARHLLDHQL